MLKKEKERNVSKRLISVSSQVFSCSLQGGVQERGVRRAHARGTHKSGPFCPPCPPSQQGLDDPNSWRLIHQVASLNFLLYADASSPGTDRKSSQHASPTCATHSVCSAALQRGLCSPNPEVCVNTEQLQQWMNFHHTIINLSDEMCPFVSVINTCSAGGALQWQQTAAWTRPRKAKIQYWYKNPNEKDLICNSSYLFTSTCASQRKLFSCVWLICVHFLNNLWKMLSIFNLILILF